MGQIVVFSKSKCPHCVEAKGLLAELDIPYTDIDIEADIGNSMLMSLASGRHTVPQIFFNDDHIGGSAELKRLDHDTIRDRARRALSATAEPSFLGSNYSPEQLEAAVIPIKDILEPHLPDDPTTIPEYAVVSILYRALFGFLCNCYDQMVLRPELLALWIGVLSSMMSLTEKQVNTDFGMSCLSSAYKTNCAYCSAHGADLSTQYGGQAPEQVKALLDFLRGEKTLDELPFDERLKAIINLSAGMTTQSITLSDIEHARKAVGIGELRNLVTSIGGIGGIMGFLNRWNDLVGVEIEASIKQAIDSSPLAADWDWGTHDTEDKKNRHDFRDQQPPMSGPPSAADFRALTDHMREAVFAELAPLHEKFAGCDEALLPAWIGDYPEEHAVKSVSALYHAVFNTGDLKPETKHLAAWVLTLGAGQPEMAHEERRIAARVSEDPAGLAQKLARLEDFATGGELAADEVLSPAEAAAVRLARVAQVFPHVARGELVRELDSALTPEQIVELIVALAVTGMGQRWININGVYKEYTLG